MQTKAPDYWPANIATSGIATPSLILREQARYLGQKTKNVVEGRVLPTPMGESIVVYFDLVVPALNNYSFRLLRVVHGPLGYPADVHFLDTETKGGPLSGKHFRAGNETSFRKFLKQVLASDETRRILGSLITQART
ncbi:MAG: hypothetical protein M5U26_24965 [Planctomycetota bacterium]|nr:hypothetical protein [Planctomycetota bacterium]